jgi:hypothetical protein
MGLAALIGAATIMAMTPPISPEDKEADRHGWAMLQRARPQVDWNKSSLRRADLTGDGKLARVMMGHDDERQVYVGVVRPDLREGAHNPHVVELGRQESLTLAFHKLERAEECLTPGDVPLDGCKPRKGQRGLTITLGAAPAQRLYWNATIRRFAVWVP